MITEFMQMTFKLVNFSTNIFPRLAVESVNLSLHKISEDDFSYYLCNIQMSTPFSLLTIQITDVENTILSLKENETHFTTYPNKILKHFSNLVSYC